MSPALIITVEIGGISVVVDESHAILHSKGLYLRNVRLPERMAVLVRISRGQEQVSIRGSACKSCGDEGVVIEFDPMPREAADELAILLLGHRSAV